MGRHNHQSSSSSSAAAAAASDCGGGAANRRSNPPRRARNAQSATAAQANALQSTSTRSSHSSAVASPPAAASTSRARRPAAASAGTHPSPPTPASPNIGTGSTATVGHTSTGATPTSPSNVSTPTGSLQFEQDPITALGTRDEGMDPAQLSALVAALGPVPSGWSVSADEPYHRFDKSAFAGAELPATLDADSRAKCLAFLQDPKVLRVTELEPSVEGLPRLAACVCPICGTLVRDNWVPSRSGGFRRQIRTESLKEHLGMRHHLLRRVKCPVQDLSGCNCKGYCKAHRLLNHFSDNIGCLIHVDRLLAAHDSASTHVLSTMQWALGSDWPRAYDELANAALLASGRPAVVDLGVQFDKCRELVLSRVAKSRKVSVNVIEQAIVVHRREQTAASRFGLWGTSSVADDGQGGELTAAASAAAPDGVTTGAAASPAVHSQLQVPSRTSTLDSLLALPDSSTSHSSTSRSPLLIVTSASTIDPLFDHFQLQPMSPTASDGASNWSQGTSTSTSVSGAPHQDAPMLPSTTMDQFLQQDAFLGSLGMFTTAPSQFDSAFPQPPNDIPLHAPLSIGLPTLPPGFVLPSALDTRTAPPHFFSPSHSNPHTPVQSPIQPPAPVMLEVPDWVQAHIPASVSPTVSPATSPYLIAAQPPNAPPAASPAVTGLTPLMDQHLRFPATTSPAASPSLFASTAPFLGGVYSPQLLASPALLGGTASAAPSAMSPVVSLAAHQSPAGATHHQQQRARVMHFVPTPDNLLVDGVYIGPVGPSVATAAAAASGGSTSSGWPMAGMGFATVADALELRPGTLVGMDIE